MAGPSFRGHTVKNSFGRGRSVGPSIVHMAGSLYLCRVVIGREGRKFVPCVVLCGMDRDQLDDFLHFVNEFRVSNELAVVLYSIWLGIKRTDILCFKRVLIAIILIKLQHCHTTEV